MNPRTAFLANLTEAQFFVMWTALQQYVDNSADDMEEPRPDTQVAVDMVAKFDHAFAAMVD
jgi:hypothetical protein